MTAAAIAAAVAAAAAAAAGLVMKKGVLVVEELGKSEFERGEN